MARVFSKKMILSVIVLVWALLSLIPFNDRSFNDYIESRPTAYKNEFAAIVARAKMRVKMQQSQTLFVAIKDLAREDQIDLSMYFPDIKLIDIKNIDKKNKILMDVLLQDSKGRLKKGLDLQGGISFTLRINDKAEGLSSHEKSMQVEKAMQIMRQRLDGMGVAEPIIRERGDREIEIQLPGISTQDNPEIVDAVKRPAKLEFRLVHQSEHPKSIHDKKIPSGYEILVMESENKQTGEISEIPMFVKRIPEMTGKMVKAAGAMINNYGGFEISLAMKEPEGVEKFAAVTRDNIGRSLAIVLDGKLYSAPRINSEIPNGHASISGHFSQREALELANVLNNPLEFELELTEIQEIGPSLAEDAKASSMNAVLLGVGLVVIFMIAYYRTCGVVAVISVLANALIVLGIMAIIGATMTLPGVAALVLTIGMGVDSNILIFERMREEMQHGKRVVTSVVAGYDKAFSTIFDANITTLLSALILIWMGTGPVRGFGVILAIGIFATMFCALIFSRAMLDLLSSGKCSSLLKLKSHKMFTFDFLKRQKLAFIAAISIICCGAIAFLVRGDDIYGIDFIGGDEMVLTFEKKINTNDIEKLAEKEHLGEVVTLYQKNLNDSGEMLRLQTKEGQGQRLLTALQSAYPDAKFKLVQESHIGSSVSSQIKWNAIGAIVLSMLMILLYIAFRFELGFGLGALISTLHDILVTLGIYILLGKQFSSPMVAAILMIIGYSINDTIVVFDRIREELQMNHESTLRDIINFSINCTLSRTLLTSITTFLAAFSLYIFGAGVINDLAVIFMIGIITGTYSSIFIASPIFYFWHKGERRTVSIK